MTHGAHVQRGASAWMVLTACAVLMAAGGACLAWAYGKGHAAATLQAQRDQAARELVLEREHARQAEEAGLAAQRMSLQAQALDRQLQESKHHAATLHQQLDRALRSGDQRLSVRATACTGTELPGGTTESSPAGAQAARAELHPEDAADLFAVAADADDTARELNTCIARYESAAREMQRYRLRWKGITDVETEKPQDAS